MTLVEMLVVLAIIAVTASIAVLAIGGGGSDRVGQAEAKRLEARLQLAADRTMLDGEAIAVMAQPDGYQFVQWDPDTSEWKNTSVDLLNEAHKLPQGMSLAAPGLNGPLQLGADSGGQPFALTIVAKERRWVVDFDGMTARTVVDGHAGAVAGS